MAEATRLDDTFATEVAALEDGKGIKQCLQCGVCSSSCPVRALLPTFDPRRLIAKILLGLKEEVLASDEIWFCARCQQCTANCHKNIRPGDIITAVRTLSLREGYRKTAGAKHTLAFLQDMARHGELNEATLPVKTLGVFGTLKLIPYGVQLLLKGKVPSPLIGSIDDVKEVQALIEEFDD
ncbi:MAG: 4Fe-4S dicluster domain-containing protein [Pseudomonadales bacterium]|jgi:succinate dehydrogenase / fumarate reductase iron-sulfur subunit|nr:4Fe-4S dicluster domain-containing protein [Pseudomonadales bacterium]MDP7359044.1 4Fe-4S dicluster domain-containing protein [Pseudomonadales bacterium]HJN52161.1 4Fe-4S dicluster domain-containing protein [Pseudomonadales bacterium]|tara:strand:+ start:934 stop:1476 length:543 start_codon:yes stop_codon:yes gene_type:complete